LGWISDASQGWAALPIFLTVVGSSLAVSGFVAAAVQFVSYALGMGLVILVLTLGIGLFKGAMVGGISRALPYVERVSALLLIVAGSYDVKLPSRNQSAESAD
jgi:cytochrome c biogenesis protein CcdA